MGIDATLKALSDDTRRSILDLLKGGRMTAGDIAARFSMTQATVSHHLSVLKDAGLITDTRAGKFIYYELNLSVTEELLKWLKSLGGKQNESK